MKNPVLSNHSGCRESLSNLLYHGTTKITVEDIKDAVEQSKTAEQLQKKVNSLQHFHNFSIDKDTETTVRLKSTDALGNVTYFTVEKDMEDAAAAEITKLKQERDRFLTIAYNAIRLGQLDEQYEEKRLLKELGCSKAEYDKIME